MLFRSLAKASCELVALVILRVPPVLTVALLNLLFFLAEDFPEGDGGFFIEIDE